MFRNWIRAGVTNISDLRFKNGVLDVNTMYNIITDKANLLVELCIVRQALMPYRQLLNINLITNSQNDEIHPSNFNKSKQIYEILVRKKSSCINSMSSKFESLSFSNISINEVFQTKLVNIKEIKLKEFCYKVIYDILSCNANLKKWKIIPDDKCDVCDQVQTVKHLLYDCSYVKVLWEILESILNCKITYKEIFCGFHDGNCLYANYMTTICAYIIYKDWLLHSLENNHRPKKCNLIYFQNEICFRIDVYERAKLRYT